MFDFVPECLRLPNTPFWNFVALIGTAWILACICPGLVIGLLAYLVILGIGSLMAGGVAAIIRGLFG